MSLFGLGFDIGGQSYPWLERLSLGLAKRGPKKAGTPLIHPGVIQPIEQGRSRIETVLTDDVSAKGIPGDAVESDLSN